MLLRQCLLSLLCFQGYAFPLKALELFEVDDNDSRTAFRLKNEADSGRVVTLFCRNRCLKLRTQSAKIVRQHNEQYVNSSDDRLYFQFFVYKKPIGLETVDMTMRKKQFGLFYLVGGKTFVYKEDIGNEKTVSKWIKFFENPDVERPSDYVELDALLNGADRCDEPEKKFIVMVQDEKKCMDVHIVNLARGLKSNANITVVELKRPLSQEMEAVLKWRMPFLSDSCKMIVYLNSQTYYEMDSTVQPSLLHTSILEWKADCNQTSELNRIRSKLTEIQLEYLSEERSVQKIQENQVYVVVGAIGGIAVIALAISIFWGLQSA
ncbi:unnamed protein product [Bursaphelenchus okinawaensis]|uniref:Uncharacterized protein n=1 Tax=Bursaphelenchus okinawaensis TaxID=465554 RepID=A0A811KJ24_9BILA|nr:unnamed protein product [Bursaphelenchus okinawaensis]CAG9103606.1 unnamed protein product [Bursaphelenchus okinawaensis]